MAVEGDLLCNFLFFFDCFSGDGMGWRKDLSEWVANGVVKWDKMLLARDIREVGLQG